MKKEYNKIYKEVLKKSNKKLSPYRKLKSFYRQMKRLKPRSNRHYKKEKEIAQWYALGIGLLACSIDIQTDKEKEEYQHDSVVYFSLLTNIANDILSVVNLVDNGFEFQANNIIRNFIELIYTFLVVLLNPEKRKEYYDSGMLQNEYNVWSRNFKMSKLNEEIAKYDSKVMDEDLIIELRKMRKETYESYSSYNHNDYDICVLSCYSPNRKKSTEDPDLEYNLWGACNYNGKNILESLNRIVWMTMLYFKHIISQKEYFDKNNYIGENTRNCWDDGIAILFLLEEEMKKLWKEQGEE